MQPPGPSETPHCLAPGLYESLLKAQKLDIPTFGFGLSELEIEALLELAEYMGRQMQTWLSALGLNRVMLTEDLVGYAPLVGEVLEALRGQDGVEISLLRSLEYGVRMITRAIDAAADMEKEAFDSRAKIIIAAAYEAEGFQNANRTMLLIYSDYELARFVMLVSNRAIKRAQWAGKSRLAFETALFPDDDVVANFMRERKSADIFIVLLNDLAEIADERADTYAAAQSRKGLDEIKLYNDLIDVLVESKRPFPNLNKIRNRICKLVRATLGL